ncbi:MAG TPA: hypothetical protein VN633_15910 [Bryobacteraceae bacterium]|nr:hypothetical protein [Bryobacteraceae bacterium]
MDSSNYNALELRFERRYSSGLGLLSSYTYSKTIDYGGEQLIGDLSLRDARNIKAERGPTVSPMEIFPAASAAWMPGSINPRSQRPLNTISATPAEIFSLVPER